MKYSLLHKKLNAYTLIELIITMIISSIVISLSIWAYLNISGYLKVYNQNEELNKELSFFIYNFNRDINKCERIEGYDYSLDLLYGNSATIYYNFYTDYIERVSEFRADTFFISSDFFTYSLNEYNENVVSSINMSVNINSEIHSLSFHKNYTPEQLYNYYEY